MKEAKAKEAKANLARVAVRGSQADSKEALGAVECGKLALQRYLLLSSSIASLALGIALIISFLAVQYSEGSSARREEPRVVFLEPVVVVHLEKTAVVSAALKQVVRAVETVEQLQRLAAPPLATPGLTEATAPPPEPEEVVAAPTEEPRPPAQAAAVNEGAPPRQSPAQETVVQQRQGSVTGKITGVNLTFYDCLGQNFCGAMYNGEKVYEGAAACSWNLPIGTRFYIVGDPTGRLYACKDRGMLTNTWVDIFFYSPQDGYRWQAAVGRYGTIEIVSIP